VHRAATAFANRLTLEVTRSAVNHRRHTGGGAATAVYLTGGGSLIDELAPALGEKFHVPVQRYQPLKNIDLAADSRAAGAESAAPVLADLVGLATRLVAKNETEASLLPPTLQAALAFRKRQPVFMAAAALVVVALAPPILYFHRATTATLDRVAQVSKPLMELRALQNRNEENSRQIEEAVKQINALRGAYETKANWINFLTDLQLRLVKVEDVWLDRLQIVRAAPAEPGAVPEPPAEPPPPAADGSTPPAPEKPKGPPLRLTLSGRLLDVANPQSKVSPQSVERVKQLLASFKGSQFIAGVENERFDPNQNGLLKFDFTLVINPQKPL
jgi:type IV pilus assembly protein PilM